MKRERVDDAKQGHKASQQRACKVAGLRNSHDKYKPRSHKNEPIMAALQSAVVHYNL